MYIIDNTDYFLDNETILMFDLNNFEILQNLWVHIDCVDEGTNYCVDEGTNYINQRWYIQRNKEEMYMICILWNDTEFIDLTAVLTEIEQKITFIKQVQYVTEKGT